MNIYITAVTWRLRRERGIFDILHVESLRGVGGFRGSNACFSMQNYCVFVDRIKIVAYDACV